MQGDTGELWWRKTWRGGSELWGLPFPSTELSRRLGQEDPCAKPSGAPGRSEQESWQVVGEGLCVVGMGFIHIPAHAVIVPKEKGKQGKYKAFHTPRTRETSRVRETLKGEVGITRPFHLPSFSIFLRTKGENLILMCIHFPFKFWQGQIPEKKKKDILES